MKVFDITNYVAKGYDFETSYKKKSMTVPDQAYTVEELLARHHAGMLTDVVTPSYFPDEQSDFDDDDLEAVNRMDYMDRVDLMKLRQEAAQPLAEGTEGRKPVSETEQPAKVEVGAAGEPPMEGATAP